MTAATLPNTSRAQERHRIRCWLIIHVNSRKLPARAVEFNGSSATVQSLVPLAVGGLVRVRSRIPLLAGGALICSCRRRGL